MTYMPQPLFVEVTNKDTGRTFMAGIAHIVAISQDADGNAKIERHPDHPDVTIVETYAAIRAVLLGGNHGGI